jgi:hypothetical protein
MTKTTEPTTTDAARLNSLYPIEFDRPVQVGEIVVSPFPYWPLRPGEPANEEPRPLPAGARFRVEDVKELTDENDPLVAKRCWYARCSVLPFGPVPRG